MTHSSARDDARACWLSAAAEAGQHRGRDVFEQGDQRGGAGTGQVPEPSPAQPLVQV